MGAKITHKPDMNAAKTLGHIMGTNDIKKFLCYKNRETSLTANRFCFYAKMLEVWRKYRDFEPEGETAIRKEPLWFNHRLGTIIHKA